MQDEDKDWLPPTLRTIALVVIALCGVAVVFGMFPGTKVYKDANDCFGQVLGALFSAHGHGGNSTCESHYVLVRTESAGGWQGALALTPIVLGAMVLRRWPRPLIAFLWPLGAFVLLAIAFIVTFKLDIFSLEHKVALWPTYVVSAMLGLIFLIMVVLFVASPIVGIVRWRAWRRAARERLPEARVV